MKWIALMGGSGGLGLAMVAAATLLVVASPTMFRAAQGPGSFDQASPPAATAPTPDAAAAARPAPARGASVPEGSSLEVDRSELGEARVAEREAPQRRQVAAAEPPAEDEQDAYAMDPGNAFQPRRDIIPEALEAEVDAVAAAPEPEPDAGWNDRLADEVAAGAEQQGLEELEEAPLADNVPGQSGEADVSGDLGADQPSDLSSARRDARPPRLSSDWRSGLDAERSDAVQVELDKADALSGQARGGVIEAVASTVSGTSRQILAVWASEAYLVGGSYRSAEGVARVGLAEGQAGREAAWLYYVLGQALEAQGRGAEALTAYQDAAAQ